LAGQPGGPFTIKHNITPYHYYNNPQNVDNINTVRSYSHSRMIVEIPSIGSCKYFYITFSKDLNPIEEDRYRFFEGMNIDTHLKEKIYFGDLATAEILNYSPPYLILELKIFPNITPKELIKIKPTYQLLVDEYTVFKRLEIITYKYFDPSLELQFKCTDKYGSGGIISLYKMGKGTILKFSFDLKEDNPPIWWAIDSVIKDDKYPYYIEGHIPETPHSPTTGGP
jgi:hypothetical protein